MTVALPPDWPPCGAETTDGRAGKVCRNAGDGYGGRCRWHGGLDLPAGVWCVYYSGEGIHVGRDEPETRVSWNVAARLVELGRVRRGVFFRRSGQSLLRRLKTGPVRPRLIVRHRTVREYAFFGGPAP